MPHPYSTWSMISDLSKISITFLLLDLNIRITRANTPFAVVLIAGWWKSRLPSSGFPQFFIWCLSSIGFTVVVEFQVSLLLFLNVFPLNLSLNFILLFFSHIYIKLHYIAQFVNHVLIDIIAWHTCVFPPKDPKFASGIIIEWSHLAYKVMFHFWGMVSARLLTPQELFRGFCWYGSRQFFLIQYSLSQYQWSSTFFKGFSNCTQGFNY